MKPAFQILQKKKDLFYKLNILSVAARYDNSCSSSGRKRETQAYGLENSYLSGIYYTWTSSGRCVPLLKILLTNYCINNCKYCINRRINDVPRAIFSPEEIAYLTVELYRKNYIEGLFLSSGIYRTPDDTMELMLRTAHILRKKYLFRGYIHLKLIPGASSELIVEALKLADRVSSNLELPTEESLKKLAPEKSFPMLLNPLELVRELYENKEVKAPASTQLIIGATSDSDKVILSFAQKLYAQKMVRRVYYSAYIPVNRDSDLPAIKEPPFLREHRLYQADWLLRFYGFKVDELFQEEKNLDLRFDPKFSWAMKNLHFFPVDITKADYWELIRVPGIGPGSAKKILQARKYGVLSEEVLKTLGIPLKRAKYFVTIRGKPLVNSKKEKAFIYRQTELFSFEKNLVCAF
uniref:Putative DNA modification/repair radical SAM protein n=1 Tax=Thermodesulfobacterium geofontis TaxID=1295609 RepID=A0A7V5XFK1_9BACT